ncbi:MAG: FecR domain-containing protein [Candidatus Omnitrophica bacterium]|nr:FecR domain-containing protein [Candidatus Omnitrophota bacterium]
MGIIRFLLTIALIVSFISSGAAEESMRSAVIVSFEGRVDVQREGEKYWIPVENGSILNERDLLRTKPASRVVIDVTGITGEEITVEVEESSQLMIVEFIKDEEKKAHKTLIDLAIGKVLIKAKEIRSEESEFEVKTPTSVVGIRGTTFGVEVEAIE